MNKTLNYIRYAEETSKHNNKTLMILAAVLFVEQMTYGLAFTDMNSAIGRTHLVTSGVSFLYMLIMGTLFLQNRKEMQHRLWKDLFQFSYLFFGLGVSVFRAVYISSTDFSIPVIYIAVLYGSAFLFYYPPLWSFFLYIVTLIGFLYLGFYENQNLLYPTFVQDLVINNFLAWIGALLAYQRFTRQVDSVVLIEEQNIELLQLAGTDTLTQLHNRRKLDVCLEEMHLMALETGKVYSVIIADIDKFKQINDRYGHAVGDEVLIEVTEIFKRIVDDNHILGRWGGEEFMLLCEGSTLKEASRLAENVRYAVESNKFDIDNQITCSFGVSEFKKGLSVQEVVRNADEALYKSKNRGRNVVTPKYK